MVRVTSPQYIFIEYGMVRENKKRTKYHYTQIFLEVFFLFWSFDFCFVFKSIRIRHFTSTSLLPQSLWKTTLDHTSVSNTPVLPGVYVLFLGPFRKEPQITKLFRANNLHSLVKWPSTQKERISTKVGGEGGNSEWPFPAHKWSPMSMTFRQISFRK